MRISAWRRILSVGLTGLWMGLGGAAHGSPIAYDGFDYTAGESLYQKNGGGGWDAPGYVGWYNFWNNMPTTASIAANSLSGPTGYPATLGNSALVDAGRPTSPGLERAKRNLHPDSVVDMSQPGSVYYFSALVRLDSLSANDVNSNVLFGLANGGYVGFSGATGGIRLRAWSGAGSSVVYSWGGAGTRVLDATYLLIGRQENLGGSMKTSVMTVPATGDITGLKEPEVWTLSSTGGAVANGSVLGFSAAGAGSGGTGYAKAVVDEIRMGKTFESVTSEPTTPRSLPPPSRAETEKKPLDPRFTDHGVPAPVAATMGATATLDGNGHRVLLAWQTNIGKLLSIDIETGEARQFAMPDFPHGGSGFAVLQSRRGLWYCHVGVPGKGARLYEFDPKTMTFSFSFETKSTYACSFHEDRDGVIWLALYPDARLISYDPTTRKVTNHGSLNAENWPQYPRAGMARDNTGWVYTLIGYTRCQILGYNPATGERKAFIPENERGQGENNYAVGMGKIFLAEDGEVYAQAVTTAGAKWYRLSEGKALPLDDAPTAKPASERASCFWGNFLDFPDGSRITKLSAPYKRLNVRDSDGKERRLNFEYEAPGAMSLNVFNGPNGEIYGSTAYPRFVYRFDSANGKFFLHPETNLGGHWNSWVTRGNLIYGAFYPSGRVIEIDTTRPWAHGSSADFENADYGKQVVADPHIHRPNVLLSHPDGIHLVMVGTPTYGHTGGGMLIWNLETNKTELLTHEQLIKDQSTVAMAALPDGNLIGATSVSPGTGGERLASVPEVYIFDWKERKIVWHQPLQHNIFDILIGPDGLAYLLDGSSSELRIFDPTQRAVVRTIALSQYGKPAGSAGNGVMIRGTGGEFYMLFDKSLVKFDPATGSHEKLADLPVTPRGSLALHEGRLYFASGSHLWSFQLQQ